MGINLPKLEQYKTGYVNNGTVLPLKKISVCQKGLLEELPNVASKTGWPWNIQVETKLYDKRENWPKLTIVTPSYNQANFIEETIRSILLQNYPNLEYIIIDGGSTDSTLEILQKYSPWISFYESVKDEGQGQAINKGFSLASGDYYAWINSDDYYLEGSFFKVLSKFIQTKTSFIYGYSYSFDGQCNKMELKKTPPLFDFLLRIPSLQQPSCFWSSKIHQPVWEELVCSLDYELWLRLVKGKNRKRIKLPLSVANIHPEAKTHNEEMGNNWQKDHNLICNPDAHGVVKNWNIIYYTQKILSKFFR
ncbi:glycosyltransferase family 2 protein [Pedobacter ghigonis]|uniref:glycosyltransferase family 2 protein n=1 Tax=Pedobacter ghigonis TaxID=2730403 RepID=UPI001C37B9FD|nr:glycosyltransferase family 2 protein [Pedobacter ghigonis]